MSARTLTFARSATVFVEGIAAKTAGDLCVTCQPSFDGAQDGPEPSRGTVARAYAGNRERRILRLASLSFTTFEMSVRWLGLP